MKLLLSVLTVFLFVSCAGSSNNPPEDKTNCCAPNPTVMSFKTAKGFKYVKWGQVLSVTVTLFPKFPETTPSETRTFKGKDAINVISQFYLFKPEVGATPSSMSTGAIKVLYWDDESGAELSHFFTIENSRLIQDLKFKDVIYKPYTTFDLEWLLKQPVTETEE